MNKRLGHGPKPCMQGGHLGHMFNDGSNDIRAAKANGMTSIAVATGIFDVQTLEKAGADYVFEDLSNSARLFEVLDPV